MSKGRPEKERKEGQKLFGKKKELLLLVVKKEQKQPRPRNSEKKEKKRLVAPQKKKATPRLDSVFKKSVTHSFFSREAYNDLL